MGLWNSKTGNIYDKDAWFNNLFGSASDEECRQFKRKQRLKYIIHTCIVCAVIAVSFIILSLNGVFDREEILYYKYKAYNNDTLLNLGNITPYERMRNYDLKDIREISGEEFTNIDEKMLDYTMYAVAAEYCIPGGLVIESYKITDTFKAKNKNGEFLLLCDMLLECYDINKNEHSYAGFNVVVYPGIKKSSKKLLAGSYIYHVNDSLTSGEDSHVYRDIVIKPQPSEEGYCVIVEDIRGLKRPGCGNFFFEVFNGYEPSISTSFIVSEELREDKVYLFDRSVTGSNLIFEMEFKNGKLIMRYCREGEDIDSKDYMEMEE